MDLNKVEQRCKKEGITELHRVFSILSELGDSKGKRILEVGCGNSPEGRFLSEKNEVHGIDYSEKALYVARKFIIAKRANLEKRFPYPDNHFDAAICVEVLEHLVSYRKTISEVRRVLKRGGLFIGTVPNVSYWWFRLRYLAHPGRLDFLTLDSEEHIRFFTKEKLEKTLIDAGFTDVSVTSSGGHLGWLDTGLFAQSLMFKAKK